MSSCWEKIRGEIVTGECRRFRVRRPCSEFQCDRERLVRFIVDEGIIASYSLAKIAYVSIFDSYLELQKLSSERRQLTQRENLFRKDPRIQDELKLMIKEYVGMRIDKALDDAIAGILELLRYNACVYGNNNNNCRVVSCSNSKQEGDESEGLNDMEVDNFEREDTLESDDVELSDFEEFLSENFEKFRRNLRSAFVSDSVMFDDPGKQDEYYYIIAHPAEYVLGKCRDYHSHKLSSCSAREALDLYSHIRCFLEDSEYCDNVTRNRSYEALLAADSTKYRPITLLAESANYNVAELLKITTNSSNNHNDNNRNNTGYQMKKIQKLNID